PQRPASRHGGIGKWAAQPPHRLTPRRSCFVQGCLVQAGLVHCRGPKKLLSTVSLDVPSVESMRKLNAGRPRALAGAVTTSGSDRTCWGHGGAPPRSVLLISLSV